SAPCPRPATRTARTKAAVAIRAAENRRDCSSALVASAGSGLEIAAFEASLGSGLITWGWQKLRSSIARLVQAYTVPRVGAVTSDLAAGASRPRREYTSASQGGNRMTARAVVGPLVALSLL